MENSYVERRNGSIKRELLNAHLFQTLEKARYQAEIWRQEYNEKSPYDSLGHVPPAEYKINS